MGIEIYLNSKEDILHPSTLPRWSNEKHVADFLTRNTYKLLMVDTLPLLLRTEIGGIKFSQSYCTRWNRLKRHLLYYGRSISSTNLILLWYLWSVCLQFYSVFVQCLQKIDSSFFQNHTLNLQMNYTKWQTKNQRWLLLVLVTIYNVRAFSVPNFLASGKCFALPCQSRTVKIVFDSLFWFEFADVNCSLYRWSLSGGLWDEWKTAMTKGWIKETVYYKFCKIVKYEI